MPFLQLGMYSHSPYVLYHLDLHHPSISVSSSLPPRSPANGKAVHARLPPCEDAEQLREGGAAESGGAAAEIRRLQPVRVCPEGSDPHERGEVPQGYSVFRYSTQAKRWQDGGKHQHHVATELLGHNKATHTMRPCFSCSVYYHLVYKKGITYS